MIGLDRKESRHDPALRREGRGRAGDRDRGGAVHRDRGAHRGARRLQRGPARLRHATRRRASRARCSASSRSATCRRRATLREFRVERRRPDFEVGQTLNVDAVREGRARGRAGRHQGPRLRGRGASATGSWPATRRTVRRTASSRARSARRRIRRASSRASACRAAWAATRSPSRTSRWSAWTPEQNVLMVRGAVPGPRTASVLVRKRED